MCLGSLGCADSLSVCFMHRNSFVRIVQEDLVEALTNNPDAQAEFIRQLEK